MSCSSHSQPGNCGEMRTCPAASYRFFSFALVVTAWICPVALATSAQQEGPIAAGDVTPTSIISEKLSFYNERFPRIQFVHAKGGEQWHEDYTTVLTLLGREATSLDYEHPKEFRQDLVDANLHRIKVMLVNDLASASLFRVGQGSTVDRENLCVITLNPDAVVPNDAEATRYIANLPDELAGKIHPTRFLDNQQHLRFAIDHEAFHCLDSLYNGGAPMTDRPLGGEYNQFLREGAADSFAAAIHLRAHEQKTDYLQNMMHLRAIWMFSDGPNRCTFESIRETTGTDLSELRSMTLSELIDYSTQVGKSMGGSYEYFVQQRAAALAAAREFGFEVQIYDSAWKHLEEITPKEELVDYRIKWYRYFLGTLFNDQKISFDMPRAPE